MPYIGPGPSTAAAGAAAGATSVSSGHLAVSSGLIAILSGNIAISGSVSVLAGSVSVSSGLVAVTSGNIAISGSVTVLSGIVTTPQLPAAAALADNLANPTTAQLGTNVLVWDATNSVWVRQRGRHARNVIASASRSPGGGGTTATSTQTAYSEHSILAVLNITANPGGSVVLRLINTINSVASVLCQTGPLSGNVPYVLACGPSFAGLATATLGGAALGGQVACICGLPIAQSFALDVYHNASGAWTYSLEIETF